MVVHAGMGMESPFQQLKDKLRDRFFDVGMAEQHAVTFSAGLSCGGLKPFCIIPASFLQRAYDQVPTAFTDFEFTPNIVILPKRFRNAFISLLFRLGGSRCRPAENPGAFCPYECRISRV